MPRPTNIHHHPPPAKIYPSPPTTSQNISTTTHYHPPPAKICPPPLTTSQNISTTTQHFKKMDHHPAKVKIYSYITCSWHCFNSFFSSKCNIAFREGVLCDNVLISSFFKFQISTYIQKR